jgi:hypothetical protein
VVTDGTTVTTDVIVTQVAPAKRGERHVFPTPSVLRTIPERALSTACSALHLGKCTSTVCITTKYPQPTVTRTLTTHSKARNPQTVKVTKTFTKYITRLTTNVIRTLLTKDVTRTSTASVISTSTITAVSTTTATDTATVTITDDYITTVTAFVTADFTTDLTSYTTLDVTSYKTAEITEDVTLDVTSTATTGVPTTQSTTKTLHFTVSETTTATENLTATETESTTKTETTTFTVAVTEVETVISTSTISATVTSPTTVQTAATITVDLLNTIVITSTVDVTVTQTVSTTTTVTSTSTTTLPAPTCGVNLIQSPSFAGDSGAALGAWAFTSTLFGRYAFVTGKTTPYAIMLYSSGNGFSTAKLTQTFKTVIGKTYNFSAAYNAVSGNAASAMTCTYGSGSFVVSLGATPKGVWRSISANYVATSISTTLTCSLTTPVLASIYLSEFSFKC